MSDVSYSGPLFDGTAPGIIDRYAKAAQDKLGQHAEDEVHARLGEVIRHPTGYYEAHIHTERQVNDLVVTDTPVVYGPWLEGTGSRNAANAASGPAGTSTYTGTLSVRPAASSASSQTARCTPGAHALAAWSAGFAVRTAPFSGRIA